MERYFMGLWRDSNFRKFWFGQSISLFGSEITIIALPLMAALLLKATPLQIGFLNTAAFAPFILFTLVAGVWIDRCRRRPVMIAVDIGRGLLTLLIPLLVWLRLLQMEYLYAIMFLTGSLNVLFELAYQSFLPSLLKREQLTEGNSKLFASASLAAISGPRIAGVLVEVLTAPFALLIDGISFLVSAMSLWAIDKAETEAFLAAPRQSIWQDIKMGCE
jgi:MFS family permease